MNRRQQRDRGCRGRQQQAHGAELDVDPGKDSNLARALQPISVTPLSSLIIAEPTDQNMADDKHSSISFFLRGYFSDPLFCKETSTLKDSDRKMSIKCLILVGITFLDQCVANCSVSEWVALTGTLCVLISVTSALGTNACSEFSLLTL